MLLRIARSLGLFALVAAQLTACKTKPSAPPQPVVPQLALETVEKTSPRLIASGCVPSIEGTLDEMGRMAKTLGLPFGRDEARAMVVARSGLPEAVLASLALDKPIGFAFVGRDKPHVDPFGAIAIGLKGDRADALVGGLGTKSGAKDDAVEITRPDATKVWLVVRNGVVVASDSLEALVAAGEQALAARAAIAGDDLVVRLMPEGIAKTQGTDVKTAMADFQTKVGSIAASQGGASDPAITRAALAPFAGFVNDLAHAELGLRIDETRGVALFGRAHPKAGSQLEKDIAAGSPARLDPGLLVGPAPAVVMAMSHAPWFFTFYRAYLQGFVDAGIPLGAEMEKMIAAFEHTTASSGIGRMGSRGLEFESVVTAKEETGGTVLLDAMGTFASAPAMKDLLARAAGPPAKGMKLTWKRQGETGRLEVTLPKGLKKDELAMLKSLFGGPTVTMHVAGRGPRLVSALGASAPTRAAALLAPAEAPAAWPEISSVLAELENEHGYVYFDMLQLMRPMLGGLAAQDPNAGQVGAMLSAPMFADLRLPLVESWHGGKTFDFELRVPMMTLTNAATAARPFLGGGAGGGAASPPK